VVTGAARTNARLERNHQAFRRRPIRRLTSAIANGEAVRVGLIIAPTIINFARRAN